MVEKRRLAARNCRIAGYRKRTETYYRCMKALIARDIQRTRERAAVRVQEAADRHGLCLSQETLRVARCLEI